MNEALRERQVEKGHTAEHDDLHSGDQLSVAAASYALLEAEYERISRVEGTT